MFVRNTEDGKRTILHRTDFCTEGILTVKKNKTVVLGAAALCVGMLGFTGCSNQVMGKREYVPVTSDAAATPMPEGISTPAETLPQTPAPAPTPAQPPKSQQTYQPMKQTASAPVTHVPAGKGGDAVGGPARTHLVKSGDTLGHLAHQYGVSVAAIMQANSLDEAKAKRLRVGQKLTIPASSGKAVVASGKAADKTVAKTADKATDKATDKAAVKSGGVNADGTYTVQPGDFPGKIARKLGVKEADLMKANNFGPDAAKRLQVGQKLVVPGKAATGAASTAKPTEKTTPAASGTAVVPGNEQLDSVLVESEVKTPTAGVTPQVVETKTVDTAAQIATDEVVPALNQIPVIVDQDTTVEVFAAKHNVAVDKLKELNPGTLPADGKLTKNLLLMIPGK